MKNSVGYWPTILATVLLLTVLGYLSTIVDPNSANPEFTLTQIRIPRLLVAIGVGVALALAGTFLQLATNNPLSEPELLGINQSAVFAVVVLILVQGGSGGHPGLFLLAGLAGGAVSGGAVLLMAASGAFRRERLILAGLTMAFFFGSASSGLLLFKESDLFELLHWTAGKLSGVTWLDVGLIAPVLFIALMLCVVRAAEWNALVLGDDVARNLGIDPVARRVELVGVAVLLCAACVAIAGPIGFVGIIVPHLAHHMVGLDYRRRLPLTALLGALLLVGSDYLGRLLIHPAEIPVGILTALVGTPYFLYRAQKL